MTERTVHLLVSPDAGRGKAANALTAVRAALASEGVDVVDISGTTAADS
ncbi:MAG: diacylglycerol kinase family lipid kinase, partial [Actinobacteria bacterium]|nr:diacylglycerol kinase family lipid kinase [Actinomycetota bacterium]